MQGGFPDPGSCEGGCFGGFGALRGVLVCLGLFGGGCGVSRSFNTLDLWNRRSRVLPATLILILIAPMDHGLYYLAKELRACSFWTFISSNTCPYIPGGPIFPFDCRIGILAS